jgi:hypothetical protein
MKDLIKNEFELDFEESGLSLEDYIREQEEIKNDVVGMYDLMFCNLEVDDKELVDESWKEWKEEKRV